MTNDFGPYYQGQWTKSVLFLDIDGVLVTGKTVGQHVVVDGLPLNPFWQPAVAELNRVVRETGCEIVVSSSWRTAKKKVWDKVLKHFAQQGVERRPIDITPVLDGKTEGGVYTAVQRGTEIKAWLDLHPEVTHFAVVDDDRDMEGVRDHFVWVCKGMFLDGLLPAHADRLIEIIKGRDHA